MIRFHVLEFLSKVCKAEINPRNLFFFFSSNFFMILYISFRLYAIRAIKSRPFQVVHRIRMYGGFQLLFWNVKCCSSAVLETLHILLVSDSQPVKKIHEEHLDQRTSLVWLPTLWSSAVLCISGFLVQGFALSWSLSVSGWVLLQSRTRENIF